MASSWKGYRSITVNDLRFRWLCGFHYPAEMGSVGFAKNGANWPPDTLLVRLESSPHKTLTVCWKACRGPFVTPSLVRKLIEKAIAKKWPSELSELCLDGEAEGISHRC